MDITTTARPSRVRRVHRWSSITFTATVLLTTAAIIAGWGTAWVVYTPLPPLGFLLFTGMVMFWRPYLARRGLNRGTSPLSR